MCSLGVGWGHGSLRLGTRYTSIEIACMYQLLQVASITYWLHESMLYGVQSLDFESMFSFE